MSWLCGAHRHGVHPDATELWKGLVTWQAF